MKKSIEPEKRQPLRPFKRRVRTGLRLDRVHPSDFFRYDFTFACEQCSHYINASKTCSIGYFAQHKRQQQLDLYNLTGHMAFCRFLEID